MFSFKPQKHGAGVPSKKDTPRTTQEDDACFPPVEIRNESIAGRVSSANGRVDKGNTSVADGLYMKLHVGNIGNVVILERPQQALLQHNQLLSRKSIPHMLLCCQSLVEISPTLWFAFDLPSK